MVHLQLDLSTSFELLNLRGCEKFETTLEINIKSLVRATFTSNYQIGAHPLAHSGLFEGSALLEKTWLI